MLSDTGPRVKDNSSGMISLITHVSPIDITLRQIFLIHSGVFVPLPEQVAKLIDAELVSSSEFNGYFWRQVLVMKAFSLREPTIMELYLETLVIPYLEMLMRQSRELYLTSLDDISMTMDDRVSVILPKDFLRFIRKTLQTDLAIDRLLATRLFWAEAKVYGLMRYVNAYPDNYMLRRSATDQLMQNEDKALTKAEKIDYVVRQLRTYIEESELEKIVLTRSLFENIQMNPSLIAEKLERNTINRLTSLLSELPLLKGDMALMFAGCWEFIKKADLVTVVEDPLRNRVPRPIRKDYEKDLLINIREYLRGNLGSDSFNLAVTSAQVAKHRDSIRELDTFVPPYILYQILPTLTHGNERELVKYLQAFWTLAKRKRWLAKKASNHAAQEQKFEQHRRSISDLIGQHQLRVTFASNWNSLFQKYLYSAKFTLLRHLNSLHIYLPGEVLEYINSLEMSDRDKRYLKLMSWQLLYEQNCIINLPRET